MKVRSAGVALALIAFLLTGCAPEPGTGKSPAPAAGGPTTSSPAATRTPAPSRSGTPNSRTWAMPEDCAAVVSPEDLVRIDGRLQPMEYVETSPWEAGGKSRWEYSLGPVALAAMASATESAKCAWGIPSTDAGATVFVGRITEQTAKGLTAALSDSVWETSRVPGAAHAFSNPVNSDHRVSTHLVIDGTLLVIDEHTIAHPSEDFAAFAFANVHG